MSATKVQYFASSCMRWLSSPALACPNCASRRHVTVDRKYLVTVLRRCEACQLLYRAPADNNSINKRFYQKAYKQGYATELPSSERLQRLLQSQFKGSECSYEYYISILHGLGLGEGARILDYGCSWDYGSWQLMQAGFRVRAFEISQPRAEFAREKLGVDCTFDPSSELIPAGERHSFDCFFFAHVLEHVPSPQRVIELAHLALRPGGLFVAFTPNGSETYRRVDPTGWHLFWGKAHPNLIDERYYHAAFASNIIHLDTSPADLDALAGFVEGKPHRQRVLAGGELLCVSRF